MPYLFELSTGRQVWVPDDEVQDRWMSGRYAFAKGQRVNVATGEGQYEMVDQERFGDVINSGGSYDPIAQRVLRNETNYYEGKNVASFALGLGRGVTGGLSDVALVKSGLYDKNELDKMEGYNPYLSGAGEMVGMIAPAVFSGGTSTAAQIARFTPAGLSARIGAKAGGMMAKKIGTAAGMMGKPLEQSMLQRVGGLAMEGAVDNALFTGSQVISEEMLGRPGSFAENMASEMSTAFLLGGAIGGVLGGVGLGGYGGKAMNKLHEIKYNSALPKGQTVEGFMNDLANGNVEAGELLAAGLRGENTVVDEILDSGVAWSARQEQAADDAVDFVQDAFEIEAGTRGILQGDGRDQLWRELLEETKKQGGKGGALDNPKEAFDASMGMLDGWTKKIDDMLARAKEDHIDTGGLDNVSKALVEIRQKILKEFESGLGGPPGVRIDYDESLGGWHRIDDSTATEKAISKEAADRQTKISEIKAHNKMIDDEIEALENVRSGEAGYESRELYKEARARRELSAKEDPALLEIIERNERLTAELEKIQGIRSPDASVRKRIKQLKKDLELSEQAYKDVEKGFRAGQDIPDPEDLLKTARRQGRYPPEASDITVKIDELNKLRKEMPDLGKYERESLERLKGKQESQVFETVDDFLGATPANTKALADRVGKVYSLMNDAKAILGENAYKLQGVEGQTVATIKQINRQDRMRSLAGQGREFLENTERWGLAGQAQKEINEAWHTMFGTSKKAAAKFGFVHQAGTKHQKLTAERGKIKRWLKGVAEGGPANPNVESSALMGQYSQDVLGYSGVVEKWFRPRKGSSTRLTEEFVNKRKKMDLNHDTMKTGLKEFQAVATGRKMLDEMANNPATSTFRELLKEQGWRGGVRFAAYTAAGWPGLIFGGMASDLGTKLHKISKEPAERLRTLRNMQAKKMKYEAKLEKSIKKTAKRLNQNAEGKFTGGDIEPISWKRRWAPFLSRQQTRWESDDGKEQSKEAILSLYGWKSDQVSFQEKVLVATGVLGGIAPQIQGALNAQITKVCMYAANNIPSSIQVTQDAWTGEWEVNGPDFAFSEFDRTMQCLDTPLKTISNSLVNGTLTSSQVRAWKENFPEEHANFCAGVINKTKVRSYAMKGLLSTLVGVPMDNTRSPKNVKAMQATWEMEKILREQGSPLNRPSALQTSAKSMQTPTYRVEDVGSTTA